MDYRKIILLERVEELLKHSTISCEENELISRLYPNFDSEVLEYLIEYLEKKQVNRIHAGLNYNMGYINWFTKKSI